MNRKLVNLIILTVLVVSTLSVLPFHVEFLPQINPVTAATLFLTGFESAWGFDHNTTVGGTMSVSSMWSAFGDKSGFFNVTNPNAQTYTAEDLPSSYDVIFMRMYLNFSDWLLTSSISRIPILTLGNGTNGMDKRVDLGIYSQSENIYIRYYNGSTQHVTSSTTWSLNTQYYIEIMYSVTDNKIAVWRDGANIADLNITLTGEVKMIHSICVGVVNGYPSDDMLQLYVDQVVVAESYIGAHVPEETPQITYDYQSPWINSTRAGNTTQFRVAISCDEALDKAVLQTNSSATPTNETWVTLSGTSDTFLYNMTITSSVGVVVQWKVFVNATSGLWNATTFLNFTTTTAYGSWIYADGAVLRKTEDDSLFQLIGAQHTSWLDNIGGNFPTKGETYSQGAGDCTEDRVKENLRAMQLWGHNHIRVHITPKWYWNSSEYVGDIYNVTQWAQDLEFYVVWDFCSVLPYPEQNQAFGPFNPHDVDSEGSKGNMFATVDEWLTFYKNFTNDLWHFPNVIFEPWNEVGGSHGSNETFRDLWFEDFLQPWVDYLRSGSDAVAIYSWGYGLDGVHTFNNELDYTILGENLMISSHYYTAGSGQLFPSEIPVTHQDVYDKWWGNSWGELNKLWANNIPWYFGESSINLARSGTDLDVEVLHMSLVWNMTIHTLNASLCYFWWRPTGQYRLLDYNAEYVPPPDAVSGKVWLQTTRKTPWTFSCGAELKDGELYLYGNETTWSESWNNNMLTVTFDGACETRVFWNVSSSYPLNTSLKARHSSGWECSALDYYDSDTGLIRLWSSTGTSWLIGYGLGAPTYSNVAWNTSIAGAPCLLSSAWDDDIGLSTYAIETNNTGTFINTTGTFSATPDWANLTVTLNTTATTVAWRVHANDTDDAWTSTSYQFITTVGDIAPTYSSVNNSTDKAGQSCTFSSSWDDDVGLSYYVFEHNNTGTMTNTTVAFSTTPSWANQSLTLNDTIGIVVAFRFHANDTDDQWNTTSWQYLTTTDDVPTYSNYGTTSTGAGKLSKFFTRWQDDLGLQYYEFQHNNTGSWANTTYAFGGAPTAAWSNRTITLNLTVGVVVQWRYRAKDTGGQWTVMAWQYLTVTVDGEAPWYGAYSVSTKDAAQPCTFTCVWSDTPYLSHGVLMTNNSGGWVNYTTTLSGTSDTFTVTLTLNDTGGVVVAYYFMANDTEDTWNSTALLSFALSYVPPTLPSFTGHPLWQYLSGSTVDFFGFVIGAYTRLMGEAFFGAILFLGFGVLYIRTKSLALCSILWLLVGGGMMVTVHVVSPLAVILVSLGLTGTLFTVFGQRSE